MSSFKNSISDTVDLIMHLVQKFKRIYIGVSFPLHFYFTLSLLFLVYIQYSSVG
jgi:hypothetical protein